MVNIISWLKRRYEGTRGLAPLSIPGQAAGPGALANIRR